MDLKAIQHEENIWNNIFKKELKKNKFEKFSSFWWEEYYNEITNFIRNNIIINLKNKNILEA
ncbi:TPA: hypothetical protein DEG21_04565 [Patescibacteria group bacterium]|nr:hypothetical protein [Candidatus Gracilibacteria bacterium]HBY75109.1 hypothetical protein [Candidatus Gracilibacteria bacterium]